MTQPDDIPHTNGSKINHKVKVKTTLFLVLRKFGSTRGVGTTGWVKLCDEKPCNLYSSANINL
jgi:hypothetical protein